jgi:serine/threonine protein kinase
VGKEFSIKKEIGSGSYGKVCEAVHIPSGQMIAIKKILNLFEDPIDTKRLLREI